MTKLDEIFEKLSIREMLARCEKKEEEKEEELISEPTPGFYRFDRKEILAATMPAYREFLREAGYADLNKCEYLGIAKEMLKKGEAIEIAKRFNLSNINKNGGYKGIYLVNISQRYARKLAEATGYKLLTAGLMYNLFIPFLKREVKNGNQDAQNSLDEMIHAKAEWLEDLISDKNKVKIGSKERILSLPHGDGYFNTLDINEFGYPKELEEWVGEFYYGCPRTGTATAFRFGGHFSMALNHKLGLSFGKKSSFSYEIGMRLARFKGAE